jgi:hypothetical protein
MCLRISIIYTRLLWLRLVNNKTKTQKKPRKNTEKKTQKKPRKNTEKTQKKPRKNPEKTQKKHRKNTEKTQKKHRKKTRKHTEKTHKKTRKKPIKTTFFTLSNKTKNKHCNIFSINKIPTITPGFSLFYIYYKVKGRLFIIVQLFKTVSKSSSSLKFSSK